MLSVNKRFYLDEIIKLPSQVISKTFPEGDLHIAPQNPTWILTNNIETKILYELMLKKSLREALCNLVPNYGENRIEKQTISLLSKIEEYGFYDETKKLSTDDYSVPLHLYLTNKCNLNCRYCYKNAGKSLNDELTTEEIKKLINDFSMNGLSTVIISGGEVFTHPYLFEILEYMKARNHNLRLVTNGTLINSKEKAQKIAGLVNFLQISLDGATPEINDYLRGKGTYEQIIKAINLFKDSNIVLNIGMVVSEYNVDDIKNNFHILLNQIEKKELQFNISSLINRGRGKYCLHRQSNSYVHQVLDKLRELGIPRKKWNVRGLRTMDCGFARSITVESNGNTYFCPAGDSKILTGLNIRNVKFKVLKNYFNEINKENSVENMTLCSNCELKYICGGGCRLENLENNNAYGLPTCTPQKKEEMYQELVKLRE